MLGREASWHAREGDHAGKRGLPGMLGEEGGGRVVPVHIPRVGRVY